MNPLEFYATQSFVTEPRKNQALFAGLPQAIPDICQTVHGVYLHFVEGAVYGYTIPEPRLQEINTRFVEDMLDIIVGLDSQPLQTPRLPANRMIGYCRTAAVLFCAMARHVGIPARHRVGFATYFVETSPEQPGSHEIAEVWDHTQSRWRLVDPHLDQRMIEKNKISFDPYDIPRDQFLVAGQAWQACRNGSAKPNGFGIGNFRGLFFVRNNMLQDLAALNKFEPLNWDNWGLMLKDLEALSDEEWYLLDRVAMVTEGTVADFAEIRSIYEDSEQLKVPQAFKSFSPVGGPVDVTLLDSYLQN